MSKEEFSGLLTKIDAEFDQLETFIEPDSDKSERFKGYLKRIYDFLKIQESRSFLDTSSSSSNNKNAKKGKAKKPPTSDASVLPELIVDRRLVDQEQIYQQLQLYNQLADSSMSVDSMTQFFSKCITRLDALTMQVDTKAKTKTHGVDSAITNGSATTDNNPDDDADDDEDEYDDDEDEDELNGGADYDDDDDDDDGGLSDDSVGQLIKKSKKFSLRPPPGSKKLEEESGQEKPVFGIPDGSDSEISDFEVPQNGEEEDEEDEKNEEEEADELELDDEEGDEDEDEEEDEEGEMSLEMQKLAKERRAKKAAADDIDSDEVDEDLVDLYDLGDEKEVMGIGKKAKSFDEVDFDDENFGFGDDDDFEDEEEREEGKEKPNAAKKGKKPSSEKETSKDLFDVEDDDDDDDEDSQEGGKKDELEGKSSFEIRQLKLQEKIDEIHGSMLKGVDEKAWQLKGEVSAKTRPQDSLLEEYLQFDHTTRQAPLVSVQTTEQLEALIKQRVKDKAFDDVERKVKPVEMQYEYKKQVALDQEKSKVGLSQIYEEEYLKKQQKEQALADGTSSQAAETQNPKHEEIRKALQGLFIKLDALSNFHFTPKTPQAEVKVVSNMPSIAIEEVAPVNVADSNVLAPEEIKSNAKALPKGKSEEDKKDKKKKLKVKKLSIKKEKVKKQKRLELEQALNPDNAKVNKELAMNKLKKQAKNMSKNITILDDKKKTKVNSALRSSTAFFQQLQEATQTGLKKLSTKNKKTKNDDNSSTNKAKKLKL